MTKLGTASFKGVSGHKYEFAIYPIEIKMKEGSGGVYFLTARKEDEHGHHSHHKLFVGETDDLSNVIETHPNKDYFDEQGANCICVHATQDVEARGKITNDLAAHYFPSAEE